MASSLKHLEEAYPSEKRRAECIEKEAEAARKEAERIERRELKLLIM